MIKIVADKDIPFLDKAFDYSDEIELLKLPYDQITNSNLKKVDALISRSVTKINEDLVSDTNLKLIFSLTSGEDHVDFDCLEEIKFQSAKGSNAQAVFEYTASALQFSTEKKIGIIGEGNIGKKIKNNLSFLGYEVISYDPYVYNHDESIKNAVLNCPIVSVNASYSRDGKYPSHELIENVFSDSLLINTSRGEVVNYKKIAKENDCTQIIDVWNNEPKLNKTDLVDAFLCTPHIAGNSFEAKSDALNLAIEEISKFFELKNLRHLDPDLRYIEIDEISLAEEIEKTLIPFNFLKQFLDIKKYSDIFKEKIKQDEAISDFSMYFQEIRKKFERLGFGNYSLSLSRTSNENKEKLSCLGFRFQEK